MNRRFEKHYCIKCMCEHWVEIIAGREICQGEDFTPHEDATHYTRWRYGGLELCEKVPTRQTQKALEWQLAQEAREQFELELSNQEW